MNRQPSTAKRGFTLIELITVIIIIGIMLAVALPKYMQMSEKAKASNAKRVLDILRKAEENHYAANSIYVGYVKGDDNSVSPIVDEISQVKIESDDEWVYGVINAGYNGFTATAKRSKGPDDARGNVLALDQNGNFLYLDEGLSYNTKLEKYWK